MGDRSHVSSMSGCVHGGSISMLNERSAGGYPQFEGFQRVSPEHIQDRLRKSAWQRVPEVSASIWLHFNISHMVV